MADDTPAPDPSQRWQSLSRECARLRGRLEAETRSSDSSLWQELHAFLQFCQLAVDEKLAEDQLGKAAVRLRRVLAKRDQRLWPRVQTLRKENAESWARELTQAGGAAFDASTEAVVTVRSVLEALGGRDMSEDVLTEVAVFAREALAQFAIQVELIRDANQPKEWFEPPTEGDVAQPTVDRVGLAVRLAPGGWIALPKGRLIVPIPMAISPAEEALAVIAELAARYSWLHPITEMVGHFRRVDPATSTEADEFIESLLRAVQPGFSKEQWRSEEIPVRQRMLDMIRQWASVAGLTVIPVCWRFDQNVKVEQLIAEHCEPHFYYHDQIPKGCVNLNRFGIRRGETTLRLRQAEVHCSAGPAPTGLTELDNCCRDPSERFQNSVLKRLNAFAKASFTGSLDVVVVQFYVDFWAEVLEPWRERQPEEALHFVNHFTYFLQHALGLFPFSPVTYQDFPDGWLQRVGGRPMVTGRVRRVVRPGLQDNQNQLRLPALVEVE